VLQKGRFLPGETCTRISKDHENLIIGLFL